MRVKNFASHKFRISGDLLDLTQWNCIMKIQARNEEYIRFKIIGCSSTRGLAITWVGNYVSGVRFWVRCLSELQRMIVHDHTKMFNPFETTFVEKEKVLLRLIQVKFLCVCPLMDPQFHIIGESTKTWTPQKKTMTKLQALKSHSDTQHK